MKKKLFSFLMGTGLVLALAACGGGGGDKDQAASDKVDAEQITAQKCSTCHGEGLKGAVGPNLTNIGSKYSKDEIENIIKNGKGGMPAGVIKGEEASAVAEWLASKK